MVKPGWSQHWLRMQPGAGCPGVAPQPGMPAQEAAELPHAMHVLWLQVGAGSAAATVKTVLIPVGNWNAKPSAVIHGVWRQLPEAPPQSESLLHGLKALAAEFVWQSFGPATIPSCSPRARPWAREPTPRERS